MIFVSESVDIYHKKDSHRASVFDNMKMLSYKVYIIHVISLLLLSYTGIRIGNNDVDFTFVSDFFFCFCSLSLSHSSDDGISMFI